MEKYEKVLKLMQSKPEGRIDINDPELIALLGEKLAAYRIPMYMSNIRTKAKLDIIGIRESRKVVAYQLVAVGAVTPAPADEPGSGALTVTPVVEMAPSSSEPSSEDHDIAQSPVAPEPPQSGETAPVADSWSI